MEAEGEACPGLEKVVQRDAEESRGDLHLPPHNPGRRSRVAQKQIKCLARGVSCRLETLARRSQPPLSCPFSVYSLPIGCPLSPHL